MDLFSIHTRDRQNRQTDRHTDRLRDWLLMSDVVQWSVEWNLVTDVRIEPIHFVQLVLLLLLFRWQDHSWALFPGTSTQHSLFKPTLLRARAALHNGPERLYTMGLSICLSVHQSVAKMRTKNAISQKLSNLKLWCLLTTHRKSYMACSKNPLLDPKNSRHPPSWKSQ